MDAVLLYVADKRFSQKREAVTFERLELAQSSRVTCHISLQPNKHLPTGPESPLTFDYHYRSLLPQDSTNNQHSTQHQYIHLNSFTHHER